MMSWQTAPYDEYKDTEYDWLGRVPSHWEKTSIRSISKLSNQRYGKRDDLELLSVYREYGVIRKASRDDNHNVESEDLSNYKYVDKGYLVLNKMKMWQGSLGVSNYEGIVSPAYIVCQLSQGLNKHYVNYLLRAAVFKTIYNRLSYGVRVGQWDMRYEDFKNIILYIPPKEEQDQIVRFLDDKISKVNRLIRAKRKQIELLKEQKDSVIYEVVTRGLEPTSKMKSSGNEWLGSIPKDWDVRYLYQVTSQQKISNKETQNQNLLSLSYGRIIQKDIDKVEGLLPSTFDTYQVVSDGNVILRLTDLQNDQKSLRVGLVTQTGIITSAYTCLSVKNSILPDYLYLLLHSFDVKKVFYGMGSGVRQSMSYKDIKRLVVIIPPLEQQERIVRFCNRVISSIDLKVASIEKKINFLSEFRTALVSQVVTGKVDVRGIEIGDPVHFEEDLDELDEGELENLEIEEVGEEE